MLQIGIQVNETKRDGDSIKWNGLNCLNWKI
jgi:hypothetical protein